MNKLIKVKDLRVSYHTYAGEVQSVRGVNFYANEGETIAIVGESGCGKSVTAKTIMGLISCPPGEIKEGSIIISDGADGYIASGYETENRRDELFELAESLFDE